MDRDAQPTPKDMKLWVDVLRFVKRGARGGALGFFTYMELSASLRPSQDLQARSQIVRDYSDMVPPLPHLPPGQAEVVRVSLTRVVRRVGLMCMCGCAQDVLHYARMGRVRKPCGADEGGVGRAGRGPDLREWSGEKLGKSGVMGAPSSCFFFVADERGR